MLARVRNGDCEHVNKEFRSRLRLLGVSVAVERDEVVAMVANVYTRL